METKQFKKSDLKKAIINEYGSIAKLKAHLKSIAVNQYGCFTSEVSVYGCRVYHTSNPNHFCKFGISIPMVGMTSTTALGKSSLTKQGKVRCPQSFVEL